MKPRISTEEAGKLMSELVSRAVVIELQLSRTDFERCNAVVFRRSAAFIAQKVQPSLVDKILDGSFPLRHRS